MRRKSNRNHVFTKLGLFLFSILGVTAGGFYTAKLPQRMEVAYAADSIGFEAPDSLIIAMPNKNNYSTTASQISILGACNVKYPLKMNGKTVETTENGFFTQYVSLSVGENSFVFENGEETFTLTVVRKKSASGGGSGSGTSTKPTFKEISGKIGELIYPYSMPYSAPGTVEIDYWPLTQYTTFRIVGEYGSYYKLPDGTYMDKSSVKVYNVKLPENRVSKSQVVYKEETHTVEASFSMKIDALYDVQFSGNSVKFVLYDTKAGKAPSVPANPMVKSVSASNDSKGRAVYTFNLYDISKLCGFDIRTKDGQMTFVMKYSPILKQSGSLAGAVILLDAGHGAKDSGTVGCMGAFGPTEKDTNLDITLRTKAELEKLGAKVVLVRDTDVFYTLDERVDLIRTIKPDLSISIHGNAMGITSDYSKSSGFLTYYSYNGLKDAASVINTSVCKSMGFTKRSTRKANLSLTRVTTCPAVLLETAFLTYPEDYEFLMKESNRQSFAEAIAGAAKDYLESVAVYEKPKTYVVQRSDTLTMIALRYKTTVDTLARLNNIKNVNIIHTGQILLLP